MQLETYFKTKYKSYKALGQMQNMNKWQFSATNLMQGPTIPILTVYVPVLYVFIFYHHFTFKVKKEVPHHLNYITPS